MGGRWPRWSPQVRESWKTSRQEKFGRPQSSTVRWVWARDTRTTARVEELAQVRDE